MVAPQIVSVLGAVVGFCAMLAWRVREGRRAVTLRNIIAPPLGMASGLSMFVLPAFRVPLSWAVLAFLIGALVLAWPLLRTSRLTLAGETVMMQRSSSFFSVLIALAIIRFVARGYFAHIMTVRQTAGLFFLLAFGMIVRWRVSMLLEYKRLTATARAAAAL